MKNIKTANFKLNDIFKSGRSCTHPSKNVEQVTGLGSSTGISSVLHDCLFSSSFWILSYPSLIPESSDQVCSLLGNSFSSWFSKTSSLSYSLWRSKIQSGNSRRSAGQYKPTTKGKQIRKAFIACNHLLPTIERSQWILETLELQQWLWSHLGFDVGKRL